MTTAKSVPQNAIKAVSISGVMIFGMNSRFGNKLIAMSAISLGDPIRLQSVP